MDLQWTENTRDSSQWSNDRSSKRNQKLSDFKQKSTKELFWINACYNSKVQKEFKIPKLQLQQQGSDGEVCVHKEKQMTEIQQEEREGISDVSNPNHLKCQEDAAAVVALLKACANEKDLHKGSRIHADILCQGKLLATNIYVGNVLVSMYAKCGALAKAQEMLEDLPARNVVTWNALITGYVQQGYSHEALNCFERMQHEGISPNVVTFICILKACGSVGATDKGEQVHAEVVRQQLLKNNTILGNALVDMYAKCECLLKAAEVFDGLTIRDVVSWNALIGGYAQHGHGFEAWKCFERMQHEHLSPNAVTYTCILKACSSIGAAEKGEQVHAEVVRKGLLENNNISLGNALVDMYAKCGSLAKAQELFDKLPTRSVVTWNVLIAGYAKCGALAKAQEVFDELPVRDVVSWSALIAGYAQHGHAHEALNCFEQMQHEGLTPNAVTFLCILKACSSLGTVEKGEEIHAEVVRRGLMEKDSTLGNALVDMYAKCGALAKAQEVFDELPVRDAISWNALVAGYAKCGAFAKAQEFFDALPHRDIVSWSALIAGYAQHGHGHEALNCFEQMQREDVTPNAVTYICILNACGSIGAAEKGEQIHAEVVRQGLLDNDISLGNALVDMYCKCGAMEKAREVFDKLPVRNVVSWSVLMAGYAQLGKIDIVFKAFDKMIGEGTEPDLVTFIVLLNACSHSGLVEEAQMYYATMSTRFGILPTLEHHTCMVDLFTRAGYFDKAVQVIETMPPSATSDYLLLWSALLSACGKWGNVKLGRLAFEHVVQLDAKDATAYISMRNIYAAASMQEEADEVEAMRMKSMSLD